MNLSRKPEIVVETLDEAWLIWAQGAIFPGLHSLDLDNNEEKARKFNAVTCKFFDDGRQCAYDGEDRQSWADNFRLNILKNFMTGNDVWYISFADIRSKSQLPRTIKASEIQKAFDRSSFNFSYNNSSRIFFEYRREHLEELFGVYWNEIILPNPIYGMLIDAEYEGELLSQSKNVRLEFSKVRLMFNTWPTENKFITFFSMRGDFFEIIKMMNPMTIDFS